MANDFDTRQYSTFALLAVIVLNTHYFITYACSRRKMSQFVYLLISDANINFIGASLR